MVVKEEYSDEEEEEEEQEEVEEEDDEFIRPRHRQRKHHRSQRPSSHRPGRSIKRHDRERDDSGSPLPEEVYAKRTCRTRSTVSYQFKEYDDLINSAIEDDLRDPKPLKPRKPPSG